MAATTSLIIDKSSSGDKKQQSVTNINPLASDKSLYQFAQALMSLSTETFEGATRVDRKALLPDASSYAIFGENEILIPTFGVANTGYYRVYNVETDEFVSTGLNWTVDFIKPVDATKLEIEVNGYIYPEFPTTFENFPRLETSLSIKNGVSEKIAVAFTLAVIAPDNARITKNIVARFVP